INDEQMISTKKCDGANLDVNEHFTVEEQKFYSNTYKEEYIKSMNVIPKIIIDITKFFKEFKDKQHDIGKAKSKGNENNLKIDKIQGIIKSVAENLLKFYADLKKVKTNFQDFLKS